MYKMGTKKHKKPLDQRKIALERMGILMQKADESFDKNKGLANRYVTLARKISMRYKIKFPTELKRKFCKHCYKYLKPGSNARVRLSKEKVVIYCDECKKFTRLPYGKRSPKKATP